MVAFSSWVFRVSPSWKARDVMRFSEDPNDGAWESQVWLPGTSPKGMGHMHRTFTHLQNLVLYIPSSYITAPSQNHTDPSVFNPSDSRFWWRAPFFLEPSLIWKCKYRTHFGKLDLSPCYISMWYSLDQKNAEQRRRLENTGIVHASHRTQELLVTIFSLQELY